MQLSNRQIKFIQQAAKVNPDLAEFIAKRAIASQASRLHLPYYSKVRFQFDVVETAPGPPATYQYTLVPGPRNAFGYGRNDPLTAGGFPAALGNATLVETNLTKRSETIAGQKVMVHGISFMLSPLSDSALAADVFENTHATLEVDGQEALQLGPLPFCPGSGGLIGGETFVTEPPIFQSSPRAWMPASNGEKRIDNFLPLPDPIVWTPSGMQDSTLIVRLATVRQLQFSLTGREAGDMCDCKPWDPPSETGQPGTFVDLWVRLHCSQLTKRSKNR